MRLLIWLAIAVFVQAEAGNQGDKKIFVPSKEWQEIKDGEAIPKGLHVRINLQTGLKEAKLMDEADDDGAKRLTALQATQAEEADEAPGPLSDSLQNLEPDSIITEEDVQRVKQQFRSYEQLKQELNEVDLAVRTDFQVLAELLGRSKAAEARPSDLQPILDDLEALLHQVDNAVEFARLGGFSGLIYPILNGSSAELKTRALQVFGAAVQNNAAVQIHALETNAVNALLQVLRHDQSLRHSCAFAVGSLLRRFPLAQRQFIASGGLDALAGAFHSPRVLALVNDLVVEYAEATDGSDGAHPQAAERQRQYQQTKLWENLHRTQWCDALRLFTLGLNLDDYDDVEKCLSAVFAAMDHCWRQFGAQDGFTEVVRELAGKLRQERANGEQEDDSVKSYLDQLYALADTILSQLEEMPYKHRLTKTEL